MASSITKSLDAVGNNVTGQWHKINTQTPIMFGASVAGTGAVAADIDVEVSFDGVNMFLKIDELELTGTTTDADADSTAIPWPYIRFVTHDVTGTGAAVTAWLAV
jgi:hypothetical protein